MYQSCLKIYWDWYQRQFGLKPQIDGSDGKALKAIIKYLELQGGNAENDFNAILSKYDQWDKFHKTQTRLRQINSNLSNIIIHLKNGQTVSNEGLLEQLSKSVEIPPFDFSTGG